MFSVQLFCRPLRYLNSLDRPVLQRACRQISHEHTLSMSEISYRTPILY